MKKKNQVNVDVFKRVSSPKEAREFTISERVTKANPHQHNTDFVASQQRVYSTKGKESELAKASEVAPEEVGRSAANPSASSSNLSKTKIRKIEAAKRARLEALKRVQKSTLTASVIPPTTDTDPALPQAHMHNQQTMGADAVALSGEKQQGDQTSQAAMGHQGIKPASDASLTGRGESPVATYTESTQAADGVPLVDLVNSSNNDFGETLLPDRLAGRAPSGEGLVGLPGEPLPNGVANPTASQADMGHHPSANAGAASLDGNLVDQAAGQADLGLHVKANAGSANLEPNALDAKVGKANMGLHVGANAGAASLDGNLVDQVAGEADMGLHVGANAGKASLEGDTFGQKAGEADMGLNVGANTTMASLEGNTSDPMAVQGDMGHQESQQSSQVSLTGRHQEAPVPSVSMAPTSASEASEADVGGASSGAGNDAVAPPSRLAEKMSKIRSKTDDITNESEVLQDSNHKP